MFSEAYLRLRVLRATTAGEDGFKITEDAIQQLWCDQLFDDRRAQTTDGQNLHVVSPGWWNRSEGPDFKGAQIEFNGKLRTGDVEIHLHGGDWTSHGHHQDPRYDNVILHVVFHPGSKPKPAATSEWKRLPTLVLSDYVEGDAEAVLDRLSTEGYRPSAPPPYGHCASLAENQGPEELENLLKLAGQWRMLFKARTLRERMDRVGADQAIYEEILKACGFSRYKSNFNTLARQLPYERAVQLAKHDPLLLEAAFLHLAGLLPETFPDGADRLPHFHRLRSLKETTLSGLRTLSLEWNRAGVRPNNNPERRLAGAARLVVRCADLGFHETFHRIWSEDLSPMKRRRAFEALFPGATGFWASHCTWTGKTLNRPNAPLGQGRIRSIIGNVVVPAALARARNERNRILEEKVQAFFEKLPKESDNRITSLMVPRIFGDETPPKLTFCLQQGLLQMYYDWCEHNPSCRNCPVPSSLEKPMAKTAGAAT